MYEITEKERLASGLVMMQISAPQVSAKMQPGQFLIVRADDHGERIPLSVADWDGQSLTVVFQEVGVSTRKLGSLEVGEGLANLAGPLGRPSTVERYGTVAVAAGCFGIGPGYALARALLEADNRVIFVAEARDRHHLFWMDRLRRMADRLVICGQDEAGADRAADVLKEAVRSGQVDRVYALGCTFMMMECSQATRPEGVPTRVSLMPVMVDGTGMCGACRCSVGGHSTLCCVEGPEFDGHQVDWPLLINRARSYLDQETESLDLYDRENWHKARKVR
ncbi:MAG: sulfide/dihydroorotate dehydrogenase-like FAD/NAD-binding protein [Methanosarcinales archaeon]|nr:sulfide/dihydroorotate dehydrogenase-like FAD/NAD-binding protein [Methanosarcinales archaeon]